MSFNFGQQPTLIGAEAHVPSGAPSASAAACGAGGFCFFGAPAHSTAAFAAASSPPSFSTAPAAAITLSSPRAAAATTFAGSAAEEAPPGSFEAHAAASAAPTSAICFDSGSFARSSSSAAVTFELEAATAPSTATAIGSFSYGSVASGGVFGATVVPLSNSGCSALVPLAASSAASPDTHPDLPPELLRRIESSDPALTKLEIKAKSNFLEAGCRVLARALSLNTCVTSLSLRNSEIGPVGANLLFPALAHLTALTCLKLYDMGLQSSGASALCSVLAHLTALTELYLGYNSLTADDGARMCAAAAAAGMTRLKTLYLGNNTLTSDDGARPCAAAAAAGQTRLDVFNLDDNGFSASDVIGCEAWRQLNLPQPPDDFVAIADCLALMQYVMSSDRAAFAAAYHPDLPPELLRRIESSDPALTKLEIKAKSKFLDAGCRVLARALSLNTCITCLDLWGTKIGPAGANFLFPALTHLTALTFFNLNLTGLRSSGASSFCSILAHLTAMTSLLLGDNFLTADDGACLSAAAAAAGMTRLKTLHLGNNGFYASDVVGCEAWRQLNLPQPPDEVVMKCGRNGFSCDVSFLVSYLLSEDKVACHAMRIFVIGESTAGKTSLVRALMSPSSKCASIDLDDRTVGIDRYDMQLLPVINSSSSSSSSSDFAAASPLGFAFSITAAVPSFASIAVPSFSGFATAAAAPAAPAIDVEIWDLAGQDVYTLSHAVHFSYRCLYALMWKPFESLDTTMCRVSLWLESLCTHVPDAHVVLVASHCKTSISDDQFLALSRDVEAAARAKVQELNDITRLEVDKLRTRVVEAEQERQRREEEYAAHARSTPELAQADSAFLQQQGHVAGDLELYTARAAAGAALPRSLRTLAADAQYAVVQERLLCERLQQLLGIRNGARPDDREACELTLHCKSVDSVQGHGVEELRGWLYDHCRSLPFMGEMISSNWTAIADAFKHFGDSVLSCTDAIALTRQHLPVLKYNKGMSDDELWSVIEFWSLVGRIFVYESQVVRDPSTLITLLKPLLHHQPLQMMRLPVYHNLLVEASLQRADTRAELSSLLIRLQTNDELQLQLLDHLSAWKDLSADQRCSMLAFFERSRLLCRINQQPDVRLITSRVRAKPYLTEAVERVTAGAAYHALYLLPLNHIAIIAHLQSAVCSLRLEYVNLENVSGRDSLLVHRTDDASCACAFSVEGFAAGVEQSQRFSSLCSKLGDPFSCVLRVASSDFGMFKFSAGCVDAALESSSFGTRYQCWVTVSQAALSGAASAARWTLFRDSTYVSHGQQQMLCRLSLSSALRRNLHEQVIPGHSVARMFQPRSSIFVSHAWGDGTAEFIARLKAHVEQQTLANVWVDQDGLNQQQEKLIPAFRDALCQARVVFVVLTPSYLTRPNCLRELRWALDLERAGHVSVVLLSLHPAVTFDGRTQLLQDGPLQGLVFSSKEKKVKRLCPEAIALVERLNDVHMNTLPWQELQAWRSDDAKSDWEEHRSYLQGGTDKTVCLAGRADGLVEQTVGVVKDWLVCAAPRPVSECAQMDDTRALTAADVTSADDVCGVLDLTRYPEAAAATLKSEMEVVTLQEEETTKKVEEDRLKAQSEVAAAARSFRCRCLQAAAVACALVLLFLLYRNGRLPMRLRRLLHLLLFWMRRR